MNPSNRYTLSILWYLLTFPFSKILFNIFTCVDLFACSKYYRLPILQSYTFWRRGWSCMNNEYIQEEHIATFKEVIIKRNVCMCACKWAPSLKNFKKLRKTRGFSGETELCLHSITLSPNNLGEYLLREIYHWFQLKLPEKTF